MKSTWLPTSILVIPPISTPECLRRNGRRPEWIAPRRERNEHSCRLKAGLKARIRHAEHSLRELDNRCICDRGFPP
jgi:hypothetical protein